MSNLKKYRMIRTEGRNSLKGLLSMIDSIDNAMYCKSGRKLHIEPPLFVYGNELMECCRGEIEFLDDVSHIVLECVPLGNDDPVPNFHTWGSLMRFLDGLKKSLPENCNPRVYVRRIVKTENKGIRCSYPFEELKNHCLAILKW